MKGFKNLIKHQKENDQLTKQAYKQMKVNSDSIIKKWE